MGPEESIVILAQQISWLSAVCRDRSGQLSYAYVGLTQSDTTSLRGYDAVFNVNVKLWSSMHQNLQSCWNTLLGPTIIVPGFPIPDRPNGLRGLEISVPAMAAMAGLSHAVSFEGGFVFKGRHHALIPVQTISSSVQWHMLDTYPEKIGWNYIRKLCPERVKGHMSDVSKRRSFVGWYPDAEDLLGMCQNLYAMNMKFKDC